MRIVVAVKFVPDPQVPTGFDDSDYTTQRTADGLLSELDEYPLEAALTLVENQENSEGHEVIALTVGPKVALNAVRKSLQIGAHRGVHILDDRIAGSDAYATSAVIAAAVRKIEAESGPVDILLTGLTSADAATSLVPAQLAERLGWAGVTYANELGVIEDGTAVSAVRVEGSEQWTQHAPMPVVVSVTDQINKPRYPSFKGIVAAKKKPVQEWSLDEVGLSEGSVGRAGSKTTVVEVSERPERVAGTVIKDDGNAAKQLVDYLAAQGLI